MRGCQRGKDNFEKAKNKELEQNNLPKEKDDHKKQDSQLWRSRSTTTVRSRSTSPAPSTVPATQPRLQAEQVS